MARARRLSAGREEKEEVIFKTSSTTSSSSSVASDMSDCGHTEVSGMWRLTREQKNSTDSDSRVEE